MILLKIKKFVSNLISGNPRIFDTLKSLYRFYNKDYLYLEIFQFLEKNKKISFVQIGSNDGLLNDPIREFIIQGKLTHGILIEPIPFLYETLKQNYEHVKSDTLKIWNGAVLPEGASTIYTIKKDRLSDYPKTATQISSFDKEHIIKHFPDSKFIQDDIEEIQVENISIDKILDTLEGKIDLLQIDIEGGELGFIFNFPFDECKPKMIIYEFDHMNKNELNKVHNYLEGIGYKVSYDKYDAVAYL